MTESLDPSYSLMNTISKIATTHPTGPPTKGNEPQNPAVHPSSKAEKSANVPPALTTAALAVPGNADNHTLGMSEQQLKRQGIESLVAVLRSLVAWGTATGKGSIDAGTDAPPSTSASRLDGMVSDTSLDKLPPPSAGEFVPRTPTPETSDDPGRFESAKQRKTILQDGIKRFNYKPKRGVEFLIEHGFIPSRDPIDIAKFLLHTDGLSKAVIGEYLGEG